MIEIKREECENENIDYNGESDDDSSSDAEEMEDSKLKGRSS
jgi:hypothetical protein